MESDRWLESNQIESRGGDRGFILQPTGDPTGFRISFCDDMPPGLMLRWLVFFMPASALTDPKEGATKYRKMRAHVGGLAADCGHEPRWLRGKLHRGRPYHTVHPTKAVARHRVRVGFCAFYCVDAKREVLETCNGL